MGASKRNLEKYTAGLRGRPDTVSFIVHVLAFFYVFHGDPVNKGFKIQYYKRFLVYRLLFIVVNQKRKAGNKERVFNQKPEAKNDRRFST